MGAKQSIYQKSGAGYYYKMSPHHYESVKKMWGSIQENTTIYGNGFFVSVCDKHPKFLKYFSKRGKAPLQIDPAMSAKFTLIMETIGYIVLDCYNNPKQLDRITGYTAMIHKDMRADIQHFLDFTSHLVDYLATMFPTDFSAECQKELKHYLSSISHEIVSKIGDFLRYEIMSPDESSRFSCNPCSLFTNDLVFGQTLLYWKDRKRIWENRLNELETIQNAELAMVTSTEDDESTAYRSKTEDELSEWTMDPILTFDRQGLHRRTQMLTTDAESVNYTDDRRTDRNTDHSDLQILSSDQQIPSRAGNLKKPGSRSERLNTPKHVTVKNSAEYDELKFDDSNTQRASGSSSARKRFRSRSSSYRSRETPLNNNSEKLDVEVEKVATSARQRRRNRVSSLNR